MADFVASFWTDLRAAIGTGAPQLLPAASPAGGGIWRVTTVEKVNWETIVTPFCVVTLRLQLEPDSAITCNVYLATAEIFYIAADSATIAETIDSVLMAIKDAIAAYNFPANGNIFLDVLEYDTTDTNRANMALLQRNEPFSAGSLTVQFRIGEGP